MPVGSIIWTAFVKMYNNKDIGEVVTAKDFKNLRITNSLFTFRQYLAKLRKSGYLNKTNEVQKHIARDIDSFSKINKINGL